MDNKELEDKLDDLMDMLHIIEDNQAIMMREITRLGEEGERDKAKHTT